MRRLTKLFYSFLLLTLLACGSSKVLSSKDPSVLSLKKKTSEIVYNWEYIKEQFSGDYEAMHSWLLESGIRARYAMMKQNMSLSIIQGIIGEQAFVSGPHQSEINFKSKTTFGHYNPVFLNKLGAHLELLYQDEAFVRSAQSFYDREFKGYFRVYYLSYAAAVQDDKVRTRYLELIENAAELDPYDYRNDPSIFLQEAFRGFAEGVENQGYNVYEGFVCPGFWVRRSIDGTADEFYSLLLSAMKTFDSDFL